MFHSYYCFNNRYYSELKPQIVCFDMEYKGIRVNGDGTNGSKMSRIMDWACSLSLPCILFVLQTVITLMSSSVFEQITDCMYQSLVSMAHVNVDRYSEIREWSIWYRQTDEHGLRIARIWSVEARWEGYWSNLKNVFWSHYLLCGGGRQRQQP